MKRDNEMNNRDFLNYCQLAFINGISDAMAVIILHKVFVVLVTGNIIFLITDMAVHFEFKDWVRLSLLANFILSEIVVHRTLAQKTIHFRISLAIFFIVTYCITGILATNSHNIDANSWGFFIVANIAAIASVTINNIFYRFHTTKFNLVAYTMNLLNLIHMLMDKKYSDAKVLGITFFCFIMGLLVASFMVVKWSFFTVLIIIPILINLYITNRNQFKLTENTSKT